MLEEAKKFVIEEKSQEKISNSMDDHIDIEIEDFMGHSISNWSNIC